MEWSGASSRRRDETTSRRTTRRQGKAMRCALSADLPPSPAHRPLGCSHTAASHTQHSASTVTGTNNWHAAPLICDRSQRCSRSTARPPAAAAAVSSRSRRIATRPPPSAMQRPFHSAIDHLYDAHAHAGKQCARCGFGGRRWRCDAHCSSVRAHCASVCVSVFTRRRGSCSSTAPSTRWTRTASESESVATRDQAHRDPRGARDTAPPPPPPPPLRPSARPHCRSILTLRLRRALATKQELEGSTARATPPV